jgi:2-hydroxy-3-keto-5-methylthiopentenyl-1-phosphate phosphatase
MVQPNIAIICDFDGTLGPDMISFLLKKSGIEPEEFWALITKMVEEEGWDPAQAYMHKLLKKVPTLTRERLREIGSELPLYPGIPNVFPELKEFVRTNRDLKSIPINLHFYIISGGLEEIIYGTAVAAHVNGVFACDFHYDQPTGLATAVKRTISFTEKTKFVYAINKGISPEDIRRKPYLVNSAIDMGSRPIPISQMIYIGDGPSDIPCLSMILQNKGEGIGVSEMSQTLKKGYELARWGRTSVGPYSADYRTGSDMREILQTILLARGTEIGIELRKALRSPPQH